MKYIEPPSQPKPKELSKKKIKESKQEKRDKRMGQTVAILFVISLLVGSFFLYMLYLILNGL